MRLGLRLEARTRTRCGALLLAIAAAFVTVTASGGAHADPARDSSRVEFSRGVAFVKQGNYRAAREAFADAYRLYPHPSILLNLGIAQWKTGQFVEASP
jgi:tetratricopeptide (TPR) repeat protein